MRKLLLFIGIIFFAPFIGLSQSNQALLDSSIVNLDKSKLSTGVLLSNKFDSILNLHQRTKGVNEYDYNRWRDVNFYFSKSNFGDKKIPSHSSLKQTNDSIVYNNILNNKYTIPIFIENYKYNTIKKDAIQKGLIVNKKGRFYNNITSTESPYEEKRIVTLGIFPKSTTEKELSFWFDKESYISNTNENIISFKFDAGDGLGFRNISENEEIKIIYTDEGEKELTIEIKTETETIVAKSSLNVLIKCIPNSFPDKAPWSTVVSGKTYWRIHSKLTYGGLGSVGNAYLKLSDDKIFDKPFIFVEGIDFNGDSYVGDQLRFGDLGWCGITSGGDNQLPLNDNHYFFLDKYQYLIQKLKDKNYDIIILDFRDGADFVQRNSMLLVELINIVNSTKIGTEPIIVSGASMGGQVSRYALAYMEEHNMPHCANLYVSMDSPHRGSYIAPGLQQMMSFLAYESINIISSSAMDQLDHTLKRPAAKQLLNWNVVPGSSMYRDTYYGELNNLNGTGYPEKVRRIGIANGTRNGNGLDFNNGDQLFKLKWGIGKVANIISLNVRATPGLVFEGKVPSSGAALLTGVGLCAVTPPIICAAYWSSGIGFSKSSLQLPPSSAGWDNCPGGKRNTFTDVKKEFTEQFKILGFLGPSISGKEDHTFIPTISALDINTTNLFYSFTNNANLVNSGMTSFHSVYAPDDYNEQHSEGTIDNIDFLLKESFNSYLIETPLISSSANGGVFNYGQEFSTLISSQVVKNGGKLYINANMPANIHSDYGVGDVPTPGSTFNVETCFCNDVKIEIGNNGELHLGDATTNNIANLTLTNNALLQIGNNANLVLNSGSNIVVQSGTTLFIQAGANVTLNGNSQIKVEAGGYICIEQGANLTYVSESNFNFDPNFIGGLNPALNIVQTGVCMDIMCGKLYTQSTIPTTINSFFELKDYSNTVQLNNIFVENGGTLRILNSQVSFAEYKGIIIRNGGKLEVINSTLKNYDCTKFWDGTCVELGGEILIKDISIIENATCGVYAGKWHLTGSPAYGGGIVKIEPECKLINNQTAIRFAPYIYTNPSFIYGCEFITNDNFINTKQFYSFIHLIDVTDVNIRGNSFISNPNISLSTRGTGIKSIGSKFYVNDYYLGGKTYQSKFENLNYGIEASNYIATPTFEVINSDFTNNYKGIVFSSINHALIRANKFTVNKQLTSTDESTGIYIEYSTGYNIQNNSFLTINNGTYGVYIKGSAAVNNIYKNSFTGLSKNIQADLQNDGLTFRCNTFSGSKTTDIAITGSANSNQGTCLSTNSAANNKFSHNGKTNGDIWINSGALGFKYSFNTNTDGTTVPYKYSSQVTLNNCTAPYTSQMCITKVIANPNDLISEIAVSGTKLTTITNKLEAGNTKALLDLALSNTAPGKIKNALLAVGPYLSDKVLIAAIQRPNRTPLPDGILKEIVVPNSPLTPEVLNILLTRKPSLAEGIIKNIQAVQIGISTRAELENEIASVTEQNGLAINELLQQYLLDSTSTNGVENMIAFLQTQTGVVFTEQLIQAYLQNGQCTEAKALLTQMHPTTPELTDFVDFFGMLADMCINGDSIYDLTDAQKQIVIEIANSETSVSANAQNLLSLVYGDYYPETYEPLVVPDSLNINGKLLSNSKCNNVAIKNINVTLLNSDLTIAEISPSKTDQNGNFAMAYADLLLLSDTAKYGFAYGENNAVENIQFKTINEWLHAEPIVIHAKTPIVSILSDTIKCFGDTIHFSAEIENAIKPFTYNWSNGKTTSSFALSSADILTPDFSVNLILKDSITCSDTSAYNITLPFPISVSLTKTDVKCIGNSDGSISTVVIGGIAPYSYIWNNYEKSANLESIYVGLYSVTVSDKNNCSASAEIEVDQPLPISINIESTSALCSGFKGSALTQINGGVAPYTYLWSNDSTTQNANNLSAGIYSLTVTDANNCFANEEVEILEPEELLIELLKTDITCFGLNNGKINSVVSGGTFPYNYLWNNGFTNSSLKNLSAGLYELTISDFNNCTKNVSIEIKEPEQIVVNYTKTDITCFGNQDGKISISLEGGVQPYNYSWNNGESTLNLENLNSGLYIVTIIDSNQCEFVEEIQIDEPSPILSIISTTPQSINLSDGTATVEVEGGTPPYSYLWNNGITSNVNSNLLAGIYYVTITDVNNCTKIDSIEVEKLLLPGMVKNHWKISEIEGNLNVILDNGDRFGSAIACIGDLNQDGIKDMLVGASFDDDGSQDNGSVYVLFMNADRSVQSYHKISSPEIPTGNLSVFGNRIDTIGDLDMDGITEVAIGAEWDFDGGAYHGALWIVSINSDGSVKWYQKISDLEGGFNEFIPTNGSFGSACTPIGDFDNDGVKDIVVGMRRQDNNKGAIYIMYLNSNGTVKNYTKIGNNIAGFNAGLNSNDQFGVSLANLGDLDGDGIIDLAVGAYQDSDDGSAKGAVWILFLNANGTVKNFNKISDRVFDGIINTGDYFGVSVENIRTADDINGDGVVDIIVGAVFTDDGGIDVGAVWVLFMNSDGSVNDYQKISGTEGGMTGLSSGDRFGASVNALGDFANDGTFNIAVGANMDDDGGTDKGAVWILELKRAASMLSTKSAMVKNGDNSNNGSSFNGIQEVITTEEDGEEKAYLSIEKENVNFKIYPNPYRTNTTINYELKDVSQMSLEVYTMTGQHIKTIYNGNQNKGTYRYDFSAKQLGYAAGTYLLKILINDEVNSYWLIEMN